VSEGRRAVLCAGNIVMDLLVRPAGEVLWGGTRWVDSIEQSPGGNGANTSFAIAKLGVPARLIGAVGWDAFGDAVLARLRDAGVDTTHVRRGDQGTAASVVLVREDGARAFLHRPGVSREVFSPDQELSASLFPGAGRLHIGNPFALVHMRTRAPLLLEGALQSGLSTSLDTAWDALGEWMKIVAPCLPHVNLLFTNEDEARMLTGSADPVTAAGRLRAEGATSVVVKLGAAGCAVFHEGSEWNAPAFRVPVIDTTGAGDCFSGAFLAALERGLDWPAAARLANAAGALSVSALGATTGLLGWDETIAWMKQAVSG
jgi:sugar/nucleoside kinase (ribokinase family)